MVKTLDGVRLFQNGETQGGFGWTDLQTEQADRIGLGGLLDNLVNDRLVWNHCVVDLEELRILNNKAAYDINAATIEVPTGPFAG